MSAEARLRELGWQLPPLPKPGGVYHPVVVVGTLCYVSGHGPLRSDGTLIVGRVGDELDREAGYRAARQTGLTILATLRSQLGTLDRVKRVVKTLGFVRAVPEFRGHPAIINGCSELWAELWGPVDGVGARSAVGMASLPGGIAVEIEAIFELHPA